MDEDANIIKPAPKLGKRNLSQVCPNVYQD